MLAEHRSDFPPAVDPAQLDLPTHHEAEEQGQRRVFAGQRALRLRASAKLHVEPLNRVRGAQRLPLRFGKGEKREQLVAAFPKTHNRPARVFAKPPVRSSAWRRRATPADLAATGTLSFENRIADENRARPQRATYFSRNCLILTRAICVPKPPQLTSKPWSLAGRTIISCSTPAFVRASFNSCACGIEMRRSLAPMIVSVGGAFTPTWVSGDRTW